VVAAGDVAHAAATEPVAPGRKRRLPPYRRIQSGDPHEPIIVPDPAPAGRLTAVNDAPPRPDRDYVLYWMIAQRRTASNFALQHAAARAAELGKPLLICEPLRAGYRWASARLHRFVLDGMADNAAACAAADVRYHAYVEPEPGAGRGLLETLAQRAALVVTDEYPCFFLPRMVAAAGERLDVRLEQVDGNGLLPLRAGEKAWPTAFAFRRHLQKHLPDHLETQPQPQPLRAASSLGKAVIAREVLERWPAPPAAALDGRDGAFLASLPIDQTVAPVALRGGARAAQRTLRAFVERKLADYGELRNEPAADATSGLSPYLHFGHIGVHEVLAALARREDWSPDRIAPTCSGKREGWWNMGAAAEGFLDELVTWRELGYGFAFHRPDDYDRFESLPDWAQRSLHAHARDRREHVYSLDEFAAARTHDRLWNAAQTQLVREGRIPNYLRMLWGKKILEWSATPQDALDVMIELNNRCALDGRDPNSYSGIFWTLGRFDRPWAPQRPVFGVIRFMSSANTARKLDVRGYVEAQLGSE
jgi:deoxyribodipyrimidine photo-lyase